MRRFLRTVLTISLATSAALTSTDAAAAPAPTPEDVEKAKVAYDEGRKAYRIGDMGKAAERFEHAYGLSENPIILYNIALAYRRYYEATKDLAHLRRAKVVLDNFLLELARDPSLGSAEDVKSVLEEIDEQIEKAEAEAEAQRAARNESRDAPSSESVAPEGPETSAGPSQAELDRAKKQRTLGFGLMGGGGALVLGGAALGVVFGLRYRSELDAFDQSVEDAAADGCPGSGSLCDDYAAQQEVLVERADNARTIAIATGAGLGVLGLGAAAGGVLLFLKSKKTLEAPNTVSSLQLLPARNGVIISGRF